jgi:hypothetical protein
LGDNYPFRPQDRGFDEVLVHGSGVVGNRWDYWENDYYDDTYYRNGIPEKCEGYCNTVWFREAIEFVRKNRHTPFFCFLSTNIPHAPLHVDAEYAEPYRSQVSERLAHYYGMIAKFDEDLAMLLEELEKLELEENTILIFMSDNGPCPWYGGIQIDEDGFVVEGYSAGMRGGKIWGYENAHRVPCFIRWPAGKIGEGRDVESLTAHMDLLPTLIEACALKNRVDTLFDGKSLMPLLDDRRSSWPDRTLFVHNQRVDFPEKYKDYQVLTDRWRLVKSTKEELYDIHADPGQKNDLSGQHPDVVEDLHQRYEKWWEDISRDFDRYDAIIIGSVYDNPTTLFSHDAHNIDGDYIWVLDVDRDGEYAFRTSRWPDAANKGIGENRQGDLEFSVHTATLSIGNIQSTVDVQPETKYAEFIVHLKAGRTCLQAIFNQGRGDPTLVAEFVSVERRGSADPAIADRYRPSDPDRLLKK